jgi:dienelactone hydrolase
VLVSQRNMIALAAALAVIGALVLLDPFDGGELPRTATATRRATTQARTPLRPRPARSHAHVPNVRITHPQPRSSGAAPSIAAQAPVPVHVLEIRALFTDPTRTMVISGRDVRRHFQTIIRYPAGLPGPFPLIVFGHGYNVSPAPYADLLNAWTRAGYIVAAPIFPLENADAPGGANERDLVNQPADMSLVISNLQSPVETEIQRISSMIDFSRIAVSGQSDGGDTALATAYGPARDTRIGAAMILSGAEDPFAPSFSMPRSGPPLLAIQGTADTINPPGDTYSYYDQAAPPKCLLTLLSAGHQPPYTEPGTELSIVEHMTIGFLDSHFKKMSAALRRYERGRSAGQGSVLSCEP